MSRILQYTSRHLILTAAVMLSVGVHGAHAQPPSQPVSSVPLPVSPAGTAVLPPAAAVLPAASAVTPAANVIPTASPAATTPPPAALSATSAATAPTVASPIAATSAQTPTTAVAGTLVGAATAATTPAQTPADAAAAIAADPMQDEQMHVSIQQAFQLKSHLHQAEVSPDAFHSLFFTPWQYALLQEAKRGYLSRPPSSNELKGDPGAPKPQGVHELSLGGIAYRAPKDWTIWLNGQRLTPDALPDQVLDLKVADDHIDLKWFDTNTNLIFPIRMRAHQRFNLDSRIFLPGAGTQ